MSDSLIPQTGILSPWYSPGQNTGVGSHSLFKGMFLRQGLNLGLLHCRQTPHRLSHQRSPSKKAVCKPSLDGYESKTEREGSSEAAIPVPQPDSLLLALVYRVMSDRGIGLLLLRADQHATLRKCKQTKKTTNQQQGEGGGRGSVLRPTRDGSQRKQTCKCVLRTGRTATKSPRHAYDPQMASCCESAHLCF